MSRFRTRRLAAALLVVLGSLGLSAAPASADQASFTGTITDATTGEPLPSACVSAYKPNFEWAGQACSDAAGAYEIAGLDSAQTYKLQANPQFGSFHVAEWYPDAPYDYSATPVSPGRVDFALTLGGKLSGTLTTSAGAPADGYFVNVWTADLSRTVTGGSTWQGGWSSFVPVPPGEYKIEFSKPGTVSSWAYGKASGTAADLVTITAGQTTVVNDTVAAAPPGSTITGHVVDEDTQAPVQSCVSVTPSDSFQSVAYMCTTDTGEFRFDGLDPTRTYKLRADDYLNADHIGEWYDNAPHSQLATPVATGSDITMGLARGGRVSGRLTLPGGAPAVGYWVFAEPADPGLVGGSTTTREDGSWALFSALPPGEYVMRFSDPQGASSYAYGATNRDEAARIQVEGGASVVVDDTFVVPPRGSITGSVIDAETRQPVADICVSPFPIDQPWHRSTEACTDETGTFQLDSVPIGDWALAYRDHEGRYATRYSGGSFRPSRADLVTVTDQAVTAVGRLKLREGGALVGTLVDSNGSPQAGVCPSVFFGRSDEYVIDQVTECTDEQGEWSISGLAPKRFTVSVDGGWGNPHATTWAASAPRQRDASVFDLEPGETEDAGRITRLLGGTVTGLVTDEITGEPLEGVLIDLNGHHGSRAGGVEGPYGARTDATGHYTIVGVSPDVYRPIAFGPDDSYAAEWSGNAAEPADAQRLQVKLAATTTLDFALAPGGTIAGTATFGDPPAWADVDAFSAKTGQLIGYGGVVREDDGSFSVTGLPTGEFKLKFFMERDGNVVEQWFGGETLRSATRVAVRSGETTTVSVDLG